MGMASSSTVQVLKSLFCNYTILACQDEGSHLSAQC